jgi:preprotein translocase subunit YajC
LAFVVAVGGVAFAAGRVTASPGSAAGNRPGQIVLPGGSFSPDSSFRPGQGVVAGGAGLTLEGTVTAVDEDSITLELESGDSVEVSIDGETNYHERTEADAADVSPGSEVLIELDGPVTRSGEGNSSFGSATDVTVTE